MLVLDLADDLLEDVLEGDDPGDAAVLVDDHGELQAGAAQGGHERVAVEGLRDGGHGPDALAQRGGGAGRRGHGEGLLDVDDAEDGVEVVGADGEAGDAGAAGVGDEVGEGVVGGKGQHTGARGHEVLGDPLGEPQRPVHEGGGRGVEGAVAAAGADEGAELAGGAGRAQFLDRLDADGAHEGVGGGVEGGDEQAQGAGEPGLQPDDGAGGAQGVGDRDVLGDELTEDHRQRRGEYQGQGRGEPAGEPLGYADRGQAGPDEGGDGGFGDVAGDQGGDRDGQLAAGELERQVAVGAGDGAGAAVVDGGGVLVDAAAFQGGERELGRDGDGGAEGEGDDGEQAERGEQNGHGRQRPGSGLCGVGTRCSSSGASRGPSGQCRSGSGVRGSGCAHACPVDQRRRGARR